MNIKSDALFQWTSSTYPPVNSHFDKISISELSKKHEGTYYLTVSSGQCETKRDSVVIKVTNPPATAPCSPATNSVTFDGIPDAGPFSVTESYDVSFQTRKLEGYYQLHYPDLTIIFHQYWKDIEPEDGEYKLVHVSETSNRDDPYVINITTLYQSIYFTSLGKAYVSHPNGKLTVTFCDAEFSGDNGSNFFKTSGSGSITRP
ncbi:MAG: hypothetical protein EOO02_10215 [Chitinophagaceae bacterium]|nr:MAG: hypothetical protein EOO02_10215 [Chitinophagaceae bacterium]